MTLERPILLAGLRGSGKSTLGRMLAARIGADHVDLDDRTASVLGFDSCAAALTTLGEAAFREGEARALAAVLAEPARVVSLGGGAPTAPGAVEQMRRADARIVYLRLTPEGLTRRLRASDLSQRPTLTGRGALEEIQTLFEQRDALYRTLGETIDVGDEPAETTLDRILGALGVS
ncbi:MAG: shikimate kinase [Phycisphaerales bacterium JB059]